MPTKRLYWSLQMLFFFNKLHAAGLFTHRTGSIHRGNKANISDKLLKGKQTVLERILQALAGLTQYSDWDHTVSTGLAKRSVAPPTLVFLGRRLWSEKVWWVKRKHPADGINTTVYFREECLSSNMYWIVFLFNPVLHGCNHQIFPPFILRSPAYLQNVLQLNLKHSFQPSPFCRGLGWPHVHQGLLIVTHSHNIHFSFLSLRAGCARTVSSSMTCERRTFNKVQTSADSPLGLKHNPTEATNQTSRNMGWWCCTAHAG